MKKTLMERLREIMPKKPEPIFQQHGMRLPDYHPIRHASEQFVAWLGDDIPKTPEELEAVLWTFGELLSGDMEKRYNHAMKGWSDALNCAANPIIYMSSQPSLLCDNKDKGTKP